LAHDPLYLSSKIKSSINVIGNLLKTITPFNTKRTFIEDFVSHHMNNGLEIIGVAKGISLCDICNLRILHGFGFPVLIFR
jgi:hypothetical protein